MYYTSMSYKIVSKKTNNHRTIDCILRCKQFSGRARNIKNQADKYELQAIDYFKNNPEIQEYFSEQKDFYQYAIPLKIEKNV